MTVRSARNIEKQKKKQRRALPRAKMTRIQGNTLGARQRLKKMAGKARARKAAAPTGASDRRQANSTGRPSRKALVLSAPSAARGLTPSAVACPRQIDRWRPPCAG